MRHGIISNEADVINNSAEPTTRRLNHKDVGAAYKSFVNQFINQSNIIYYNIKLDKTLKP